MSIDNKSIEVRLRQQIETAQRELDKTTEARDAALHHFRRLTKLLADVMTQSVVDDIYGHGINHPLASNDRFDAMSYAFVSRHLFWKNQYDTGVDPSHHYEVGADPKHHTEPREGCILCAERGWTHTNARNLGNYNARSAT